MDAERNAPIAARGWVHGVPPFAPFVFGRDRQPPIVFARRDGFVSKKGN
jgi:hypothetical protein